MFSTCCAGHRPVSTALEHDSIRSVVFHDCFDDWLKGALVSLVCDAVTKEHRLPTVSACVIICVHGGLTSFVLRRGGFPILV